MATILVVDDRPSNRQVLVTLLGYMSHNLLEAADGAEALRLARSARPQLVITDILMPTMDGYEFVSRLRDDPELAATPVIFYTATYSEPQAAQLAASCGVRIILPKPCDPERILEAVAEALGGSPPPPGSRAPARRPAHPMAVDDAIATHLRDLQGVKVKFDDLFHRTSGAQPARERINALSKQFSDNVQRLQGVTSRLSALVEVGLAMNAERDPGRLVHVFFAAARDIVDSKYAAVGIVDDTEESLRHVFVKGVDGAIFRAGSARAGLLGTVFAERRTLRATSAAAEPDAAGLPPGHPAIRNFLALPIASADRGYGWLYFADRNSEEAFTLEDERLAGILAAQLAMRYEHTMLFEVVQRHASTLQIEVAERRRAEAGLRESDSRFRQLAQNIHEVFWLTDAAKERVLYVSPGYEKIWGRSVESLYASPRDWVDAIHPGDRDHVLDAARTRQVAGSYDEEYRIVRPDGALRWIRDRAFPLLDEAGSVTGVTGVAEDITERKEAQLELLQTNARLEVRVTERTAQLEAANRDLESFSYSVSHDLRAPLRAIQGFSQILGERLSGQLGEEDRHLLGRIEAGGTRMGALIDDLLKFARSGTTELTVRDVDLHAIAADVVAEARPAYPAAHVRIAPLPSVRGDPGLLREVLANLVDNALKYSSKTGRPRIEIGWDPDGGRTAVFVRDNGTGFDPGYAENLFTPFRRLHSDSEFPGTGIGLALCKRIIERHGGRIWAESSPGLGASFHFTLAPAPTP